MTEKEIEEVKELAAKDAKVERVLKKDAFAAASSERNDFMTGIFLLAVFGMILACCEKESEETVRAVAIITGLAVTFLGAALIIRVRQR